MKMSILQPPFYSLKVYARPSKGEKLTKVHMKMSHSTGNLVHGDLLDSRVKDN